MLPLNNLNSDDMTWVFILIEYFFLLEVVFFLGGVIC